MAIRYARAKEMPSRLICTPHSQATAVDAVLVAYQKWNEDRCPESLLTDFLVDLLHWCDKHDLAFLDVLITSTQHYERERAEHEEIVAEVKQEMAATKK
jgi:hypothetical protein